MTSSNIDHKSVTVTAPINIALIKYWGKRDADIMLPLNDSISISIDQLFATTTVTLSSKLDCHSVTVNKKMMKVEPGNRYVKCIEKLRASVGRKRKSDQNEKGNVGESQLTNWKLGPWHCKAVSTTNFPTDAGLASSAAGFAALAFGIGTLLHVTPAAITHAARLGSGSACRSTLDGFVHWKTDGSCESIFNDWNELRAVIVVMSETSKSVGSTQGMLRSTRTSQLLKYRSEHIVPKRVLALKEAISKKDFGAFAEIVMKESNQLHAIATDTYPPLHYLSQSSRNLMAFVHEWNGNSELTPATVAYSFDAGPNCCLFTEAKNVLPLLKRLLQKRHLITSTTAIDDNLKEKTEIVTGCLSEEDMLSVRKWNAAESDNNGAKDSTFSSKTDNFAFTRLIVSRLGSGPKVVGA